MNNTNQMGGGAYSVDVIIPVFNGEKFVADAIQSAAEQTYLPKRIIVVDDGSTDGTVEVVERLIRQVSVSVVLLRKENGGPNSARNLGLKQATSEFVAFLDADDEWEVNKLERQLAVFIDGKSELGVVYCGYSLIDENGREMAGVPLIKIEETMRGDIYSKLLRGNMVVGSASAVLIRRSCFDTVGMFDESLRASEDWDMWLRIAEKFYFDFINERLIRIRRHPQNAQNDTLKMFANELLFFDKWGKRLPKDDSNLKGWAKSIAARIIKGFPSLDCFNLAQRNLSDLSRKRVFKVTRGSLAVYIFLAANYLLIRELINAAVGYLRETAGAVKRYLVRISALVRIFLSRMRTK